MLYENEELKTYRKRMEVLEEILQRYISSSQADFVSGTKST
jgi:hypothetical protein